MKKKILYISYDGMTDPLGQSQVLPYICGLSKQGYNYTLISCEKKDRFIVHRDLIQTICTENDIAWKPFLYHKSPPILSTLWDINQIQNVAYKLQEQVGFDMVHCRGYISALIGLGLKKRYSVKFLFDMRGLWADEKVDAGAWNQNSWIYRRVYRFFKRKEKEFFLNADAAISLTEVGKKEILSWDYMSGRVDNIEVIPCCVDTDLFDNTSITRQQKEYWLNVWNIKSDQYILTYLGSIGTWYMLEEMLDFFLAYRRRFVGAKFLFITYDEHDKIRYAARQRNIEKDIILEGAKRLEVPVLLSLSSHAIFFIKPTYSKISSSPTKQGEIMSMGIPVICNAGVGDTDTIVMKYGSGISIAKFDTEAYQQVVDNLDNCSRKNIREGALDYFSLTNGIQAYSSVYEAVIK